MAKVWKSAVRSNGGGVLPDIMYESLFGEYK
jgi:hypothetical protein